MLPRAALKCVNSTFLFIEAGALKYNAKIDLFVSFCYSVNSSIRRSLHSTKNYKIACPCAQRPILHQTFHTKLKAIEEQICNTITVQNHKMNMICHQRLRKHAKLKYWLLRQHCYS